MSRGEEKKTHEYAAAGGARGGKRDRCQSSKRNRNRESNPQVPWSFFDGNRYDSSVRENKLADEFDDVRKGEIRFSSFRTRVKVRRGTPRRATDDELSGMISGKSVPQRTTSFGHHICSNYSPAKRFSAEIKLPRRV